MKQLLLPYLKELEQGTENIKTEITAGGQLQKSINFKSFKLCNKVIDKPVLTTVINKSVTIRMGIALVEVL